MADGVIPNRLGALIVARAPSMTEDAIGTDGMIVPPPRMHNNEA